MTGQTRVRFDYDGGAGPSSWESSSQPHSTNPWSEESAPVQHDTPTAVYRYYDRHGVLIYAGITNQGMGRKLQHAARADWWPHVASQEVDHLPDRQSALDLERELIQRHRPPYNIQHNPDYQTIRTAYEAFVATAANVEPIVAYSALKKRVSMHLVDASPDGFITWATEPLVFRLAKELRIVDPARVVESNHKACGQILNREVVGMSVHFHCQVAQRVVQSRQGERVTGRLGVTNGRGGPTFRLRCIALTEEAA